VLNVGWLWTERSAAARLARCALIPPSLVYRGLAAARVRAYQYRLLRRRTPTVPTVSVGNLTVGGSGKTPIAAWIAQFYAARGLRPGIVLRGYGGDEALVHRRLVEGAVVIENPDRPAGAREAVARGARVLVLDDAYQRLDVGRHLNIAVVSAESSIAVRWTLPAGPWREGWRALSRADLVVVSHKGAEPEMVAAVIERVEGTVRDRPVAVARLGVSRLRGLLSGNRLRPGALRGARVVASAGVAAPETLAGQCRALGATVRLVAWPDHHRFSASDVALLRQEARGADFLVVTEKDAVKLRSQWPRSGPEPLVAELNLSWERGGATVRSALAATTADADLPESS